MKRPATQKRDLAVLLIITMILMVGLIGAFGMHAEKAELLKLAQMTEIIIPPANVDLAEIEGKLRRGQCIENGVNVCGKPLPMKKFSYNFSGAHKAVYLVSKVNFSVLKSNRRLAEEENNGTGILGSPTKDNLFTLNFGDSFGVITAWVNDIYVGTTNRQMLPSKKPFPFSMSEGIKISDKAAFSKNGEAIILVKIESLPLLPKNMSSKNYSLMLTKDYIDLELLKLLSIAMSVSAIFLLGLYHLVLLWKRKSMAYIGFVFLALAIALQNLGMYNLLIYFGVPPELSFRVRAIFGTVSFAPYIQYCLCLGEPISYIFDKVVLKRGKESFFDKFSLAQKIFCIACETVIYILTPVLMAIGLFGSLYAAAFSVFHILPGLILITCLCEYFVIFKGLLKHAAKRDISFAKPIGIGMSIVIGGAICTAITQLGSTLFSFLALGYCAAGMVICFAISMGYNFAEVNKRLNIFSNKLELILTCTRELAAVRNELDAATKAVVHILSQINIKNTPNAWIYVNKIQESLEENTKSPNSASTPKVFSGNTILDIEKTWTQIIKEGKNINNLEKSIVPEEMRSYILQSKSSGDVVLSPNQEVFVPIKMGNFYLGTLVFDRYDSEELDSDDLHFINTLTSSLAVSIENIFYMHETAEKVKIESELDAAKAVQAALLPKIQVFPGAEIYSVYQSASKTGGDWYGYYHNKQKNTLDFYIGDVTGHGVPAALIAGVVCGSVYTSEFLFERLKELENKEEIDKISAISNVSNSLLKYIGSNHMMTMIFASLNLSTGELTYTNAGHNIPYIVSTDKEQSKPIPGSGFRLGFHEQGNFTRRVIKLHKNDFIFLYTDGLIENNDGNKDNVLKMKDLRKLLTSTTDPGQIIQSVVEAAQRVWKNHPRDDDSTILMVKWLGADENASENKTNIA